MRIGRLTKLEKQLASKPRMVWFTYTEKFLEGLRPWVSLEHIEELRTKGGEWKPYRTPEEEERSAKLLTQRANDVLAALKRHYGDEWEADADEADLTHYAMFKNEN